MKKPFYTHKFKDAMTGMSIATVFSDVYIEDMQGASDLDKAVEERRKQRLSEENLKLVRLFLSSSTQKELLKGEGQYRYFIDAPNNRILCAALHRAKTKEESYYIDEFAFTFSYMRIARDQAVTEKDFFDFLFESNHSLFLSGKPYTLEHDEFQTLFSRYFMQMEPNFVGNTIETFRGLCVCTNQDHHTMFPELKDRQSILRAVKLYPCNDFHTLDSCAAITVGCDAFIRRIRATECDISSIDFGVCVFVVTLRSLIALAKKSGTTPEFKDGVQKLSESELRNMVANSSDDARLSLFIDALRGNMVVAVNFL